MYSQKAFVYTGGNLHIGRRGERQGRKGRKIK
jgi:hypothetical protein